jgi:hypothetical protein
LVRTRRQAPVSLVRLSRRALEGFGVRRPFRSELENGTSRLEDGEAAGDCVVLVAREMALMTQHPRDAYPASLCPPHAFTDNIAYSTAHAFLADEVQMTEFFCANRNARTYCVPFAQSSRCCRGATSDRVSVVRVPVRFVCSSKQEVVVESPLTSSAIYVSSTVPCQLGPYPTSYCTITHLYQ